MQKIKGWIIITILVCFEPLCSDAQVNLRFIENVQEYQKSVKIGYNRQLEKDTINTAKFNLKQYMDLFNRLEFNLDLEYDYVYFDNVLDGKPYLFAKEKSFNLEEYLSDRVNKKRVSRNKKEQLLHEELYKFLNNPIYRAYNHVTPEDSKDGYLQYLFFHELGENFALKWHANYEWRYIITSGNEMKEIVKKYWEDEFEEEKEDLEKLQELNPQPILELYPENCIITWIEETHFGFFERTYQIARSSPYRITLIDEKKLAEISTILF